MLLQMHSTSRPRWASSRPVHSWGLAGDLLRASSTWIYVMESRLQPDPPKGSIPDSPREPGTTFWSIQYISDSWRFW